MRTLITIIAVFFLSSLIPQTIPSNTRYYIIKEQKKIEFKTINYDSIINETIISFKDIRDDYKDIESNYNKVTKIEKSKDIIRKEINSNIKKLELKSDTVYIVVQDTICLSCHNHLTINE